jgi:hypothetical protein
MTAESEAHFEKQKRETVWREEGMKIDESDEQSENGQSPKHDTLDPSSNATDKRERQE